MDKKDLRIVFMGSPEFAVSQFKTIIDSGYNVVGVITAPDKPAGRGKILNESAVKKYAAENAIDGNKNTYWAKSKTCRCCKLLPRVSSSAYCNSDPTAIPLEIRVTSKS